jgi:hypothetical protein
MVSRSGLHSLPQPPNLPTFHIFDDRRPEYSIADAVRAKTAVNDARTQLAVATSLNAVITAVRTAQAALDSARRAGAPRSELRALERAVDELRRDARDTESRLVNRDAQEMRLRAQAVGLAADPLSRTSLGVPARTLPTHLVVTEPKSTNKRSRVRKRSTHSRPPEPRGVPQEPAELVGAALAELAESGHAMHRATSRSAIRNLVSRAQSAVDRARNGGAPAEQVASLKTQLQALQRDAKTCEKGLEVSDERRETNRAATSAPDVRSWEADYRQQTGGEREIVHVDTAGGLTYSYDATPAPSQTDPDNRVLAVWGKSGAALGPRDAVRMRGFPSPNGKGAKPLDRGHLAGRLFGGGEDMNLIPQDRDLNQGVSEDGKRWQSLERDLALHPGTPFYVRAIYDNNSDFPAQLEFGIQRSDGGWTQETFENR